MAFLQGQSGSSKHNMADNNNWLHGSGTTAVIDTGAIQEVSVYGTCENGTITLYGSADNSNWSTIDSASSSGSGSGSNFNTPARSQSIVSDYRYFKLTYNNYSNGYIMNAMLSVAY